jgi:16S rRNA (cytidine1402-2'-O)-methyltransferase
LQHVVADFLNVAHLSLVPTPIGNLGDITLRALETLKRAEVIAAEDTRHSQKLLQHYAIEKPLLRLDAHTIAERAEGIFSRYQTIAFITDAGTPGISDPGAELVQLALKRGDTVEVLPGATAFVPALVLSGLMSARFTFEGFLPRKGGARRERLETIAKSSATSILYEAPQRLKETLEDLITMCGDRPASVSRELSKLHETTYRGKLSEILEQLGEKEVKGEIVIVVAPVSEPEKPLDFSQEAERLKAQGLSGRALREALTALGAPRNLAYELSIAKDK